MANGQSFHAISEMLEPHRCGYCNLAFYPCNCSSVKSDSKVELVIFLKL